MHFLIGKPVGALGPKENGNVNLDVLRVQTMLTEANCGTGLELGNCDGRTVAAICDWQEAVGVRADGRLAPTDIALRRLASLLEGPLVRPITLKHISRGGYLIRMSDGVVPRAKYAVYLSLRNRSFGVGTDLAAAGELDYLVNVSGRPAGDLVGPDELVKLLEQIGKLGDQGGWGIHAHCTVYITRNNVVVSRTKGSVPFECPVKPYPGPIGDSSLPRQLDVKVADPDGPWTYTENAEPHKSGSMLHPQPIGGAYYFKYAGLFTVKNSLRGFDCTTYPGSIFGLPTTTISGFEEICSGMRARRIGMEKVKLTEFLTFMERHTDGSYLVWIGTHHIVLIDHGVCYEFNVGPGPRGPFTWDPFMRRAWSNELYTVRDLAAAVGGFEISQRARETA